MIEQIGEPAKKGDFLNDKITKKMKTAKYFRIATILLIAVSIIAFFIPYQ